MIAYLLVHFVRSLTFNLCFRVIKTEVEPSQLFEADLEEGDDPLLLDRLYLYSFSLKLLYY
jgi:hypothetical protein